MQWSAGRRVALQAAPGLLARWVNYPLFISRPLECFSGIFTPQRHRVLRRASLSARCPTNYYGWQANSRKQQLVLRQVSAVLRVLRSPDLCIRFFGIEL
jgi:hypothetical protein